LPWGNEEGRASPERLENGIASQMGARGLTEMPHSSLRTAVISTQDDHCVMTPVPAPPLQRHSPCVGICQLDERTGLCLGCARTSDEIGRWGGMSERERDAVWRLLPGRASEHDFGMRVLPWTAAEIGAWVAASIAERRGTWTTGSPGAVAEFPCTPGRDVTVEADATHIVARANDAAFRLTLHDKLRAFAMSESGPIVLGWPKARRVPYTTATLTEVGTDAEAISDAERQATLLDLGVGRASSRFCVRTSNPALLAKLKPLAGSAWQSVMYEAGMDIMAAHPNRVVESQLARIEVYTPIPLPGEQSPRGAHTHFLPEFLAAGDEIAPTLALPDYAAPVAIFYPGELRS
jgi:predicted Fe-S protein YdhL (DUF1289 family)